MKTKLAPSKYQQAIYRFIENGQGNAVVDAVAGSGKSTTIIGALASIPEDQTVLFLAFNKSIIEELETKVAMQQNVEVMTLHALGAKALLSTYNCKIQAHKYKAHLNDGIRLGSYKPLMDIDFEDVAEYKANINKLIDLVRVNLCNSTGQFEELAMKHGLNLIDNECDIAARVVRWGYKQMNCIDFTDMVYFPVMKEVKLPQYDWVFIDECQDLNAAQRELFLRCVKPGGRFVAVGDPRQAIYGFAGADVQSFNLLKAIPNTTELPLSVCYRCDADIVNLAKSLVPQIEAKENAERGVINDDASIKEVEDGDMVLCRVTAPLTKLCMNYIANGVKAYIKGKDIGVNLINMLRRTKRNNIEDAAKVFNKELLKIEKRVSETLKCSPSEAKHSSKFTSYQDKVQALNILSEGLTTTGQLIRRIENIFSEDNRQGICLSTIHKSKGLEANNVFILCPEKMYHKASMRVDWMAEQEANLVYVAYTRAKHYLGFIKDFEI